MTNEDKKDIQERIDSFNGPASSKDIADQSDKHEQFLTPIQNRKDEAQVHAFKTNSKTTSTGTSNGKNFLSTDLQTAESSSKKRKNGIRPPQ